MFPGGVQGDGQAQRFEIWNLLIDLLIWSNKCQIRQRESSSSTRLKECSKQNRFRASRNGESARNMVKDSGFWLGELERLQRYVEILDKTNKTGLNKLIESRFKYTTAEEETRNHLFWDPTEMTRQYGIESSAVWGCQTVTKCKKSLKGRTWWRNRQAQVRDSWLKEAATGVAEVRAKDGRQKVQGTVLEMCEMCKSGAGVGEHLWEGVPAVISSRVAYYTLNVSVPLPFS